ncbi:SufE family protein [Terricaulis sp.]|uniref:SufE family protein n=1 Tax=Terricaulis sp. TaxID=2768686 RepID=UPI000A4B2C8E|nr:SufE family protein [Terricaulis sp.]MDZ4690856.1 SufE family protein [Terricaulis sp.]
MATIDATITELADEFALLPDWEERISYVIELARALEPLADEHRTEANRVRGCTSQVWLVSERRQEAPEQLYFRGDSDAHLVRGEVAMLLRIFSGRTPQEILSVDPRNVFERLGLKEALTAQRSNGLFSMMKRIQDEARAAL